jgi:uncharacterized membrane protein
MLEISLNELIINGLSKVFQACFGILCHQDKSILFTMNGDYIPLCPRCIGLNVGFIVAVILFTFIKRKALLNQMNIPKGIPCILVIIVGIHWICGALGLFVTSSLTRILTGSLSGFSFGYIIYTYNTFEKNNFIVIRLPALTYLSLICVLFAVGLIYEQSQFLTTLLGILVIFNVQFILKTIISIFKKDDINNQLLNQEILE